MANRAVGLLEQEDPIDNRDIDDAASAPGQAIITSAAIDFDWLGGLTATGVTRSDAIRRLHELMLRAARFQLSRMGEASRLGHARAEEIVHSSADEAVVAILARLSSFEGRSRFTTWAYKFAILNTATAVRRELWGRTTVDLSSIPEPVSLLDDPLTQVEAAALSDALRRCISECLTAHQQRILIAVAVQGIPIDVIADRLHTSRNTVYKSLHDARKRLRVALIAQGYIQHAEEVNR